MIGLKSLLGRASPEGPSARLSLLIFHRVHPVIDPMLPTEVDATRFDRICRWLARWFNVLPLDQAMVLRRQGALPTRALSITFDDGYADNHDVALPILRAQGLTATFFIATSFLDGGRMFNDTVVEAVRNARSERIDPAEWFDDAEALPLVSLDDRRRAAASIIGRVKYLPVQRRQEVVDALARRLGATLPDGLMMRSAQVSSLYRAGMQIGAHTQTHPILRGVSREQVRAEIEGSRRVLEGLVDARVGLFAYPNGKPDVDFDAQAVDVVQSLGFDAAVTTVRGAAGPQTNPLLLPRHTPWEHDRLRFGYRLLETLRMPAP